MSIVLAVKTLTEQALPCLALPYLCYSNQKKKSKQNKTLWICGAPLLTNGFHSSPYLI